MFCILSTFWDYFQVYTVSIRSPAHLDNSPSNIDKRYSEFEHLNQVLRKKFPNHMQEIAFPRKQLTGNFKAETIAQRSRAFEQYLAHLFSINSIRISEEFTAFFYGKDLKVALNLLIAKQYTHAISAFKSADSSISG